MKYKKTVILLIVCILCLTACVKKETKPGNSMNNTTDNQVVDNKDNSKENNSTETETVDNKENSEENNDNHNTDDHDDNTGENNQNNQSGSSVEISDVIEIPIDDGEESFGE